ncbi:MAG: dihydropteroate synthase [Firmicutes bacterium]|nr:dihydropteroate synthase [Bacillota bacterium]
MKITTREASLMRRFPVIIVGGRINTSLPGIDRMVDSRDSKSIADLAIYQRDLGACAIGVNAGTRVDSEEKDVAWLVKTVQQSTRLPVWIDTPNPVAMESGLLAYDDSCGPPFVDSATAEPDRLRAMTALASRYDAFLVGLMLDESGVPPTPDARVSAGAKIVEHALSAGIPAERIFLDPLVMPIGTDRKNILTFRDTLLLAKAKLGMRISCAPDNVSFGLPATGLVDQTLTVMCVTWGADLLLLELDEQMTAAVRASAMLLGRDEHCRHFLKGFRAGLYRGFH